MQVILINERSPGILTQERLDNVMFKIGAGNTILKDLYIMNGTV